MYHQIFVEVYEPIRKVKKYYILVRYAYNIIQIETQGIISKNAML